MQYTIFISLLNIEKYPFNNWLVMFCTPIYLKAFWLQGWKHHCLVLELKRAEFGKRSIYFHGKSGKVKITLLLEPQFNGSKYRRPINLRPISFTKPKNLSFVLGTLLGTVNANKCFKMQHHIFFSKFQDEPLFCQRVNC